VSSIPDEAERLKQKWTRWAYEATKAACPECGGRQVWWDGMGERGATVLTEAGVVYVPPFPVRRARCRARPCGNRWRLLPPDLIPHKHYQPCVVARAVGRYLFEGRTTLQGVADEMGCSRRTVRRWVAWVAAVGEPSVLLEKIVAATDAVVVPWVRAAAKLGAVVGRAAEMLSLLEVLGSVWGLEPPGLRGVLHRVVRGRTGLATYTRPLIPDLARGPPG
jgi:hypothetical protein